MALRVRGESVDEIIGAVAAMRAKMLRVEAPADAIDIVGTGGDHSGSYNVSTLAAIIVAACGVPVAKHGNRAASSQLRRGRRAGGARRQDRPRPPQALTRCLARGRLGFMFAQTPSRGHAPRRPGARRARHPHDLQPARTAVQPGRRRRARCSASSPRPGSSRWPQVLSDLGSERVWIGAWLRRPRRDHHDRPDAVVALEDGAIRRFTITPEEVGLPLRAARGPAGRRSRRTTPRALRAVLDGARTPIATSRCSTRPRRSSSPAGATTCARGRAAPQAHRRGAAAGDARPPRRGLQRVTDSRRMSDILRQIEAYKRQEIADAKARVPLAELERRAARRPRRRAASRRRSRRRSRRGRPALIAEIKKASPRRA